MRNGDKVRLMIPESEVKFFSHSMNGKVVEIYSLYKTPRGEYIEFGDREGSLGAFRQEWFEEIV